MKAVIVPTWAPIHQPAVPPTNAPIAAINFCTTFSVLNQNVTGLSTSVLSRYITLLSTFIYDQVAAGGRIVNVVSIRQRLESKNLRRSVLAVYLVALLMATLSPLPSTSYDLVRGMDKLVHVSLFGGLSILLYWIGFSSMRMMVAIGMIAVSGFAGLIELLQGLLSYRSADRMDFLAGAIGALLGLGVALILDRIWNSVVATQER